MSWPRNGRRQIALAARVTCACDGLRDGGEACVARIAQLMKVEGPYIGLV